MGYTYERPWLYPKQLEAMFCPERYSFCEATVKSGKTVAALVWILEGALLEGKAGRWYWWVAPVTEQARIAYRRAKRSIPVELYEANDTRLEMQLINGAGIRFMGSDNPDSLFGEDVYRAVIDEASRVKEEAWFALRTTVTSTGGPMRIIGNVKGRRNWFWNMCRLAESGARDAKYSKITAWDAVRAGVIEEEEVEDARYRLPAGVFQELYEAEASEDHGNPFGLEAIRACISDGLSDGLPRVWGWDLAKSSDWTVGIALDSSWRVCRFERFQRDWGGTLESIRRVVGPVPALVDSTGVGDPIVEALQRGNGSFEGLKFSLQSKQQLMEGLASAIQSRKLSFPGGPIVPELESFEYVHVRRGVRYSAPQGMTDDCVDSLALAVRLADQRRVGPLFTDKDSRWGAWIIPQPPMW